jgi:hypothetical protein
MFTAGGEEVKKGKQYDFNVAPKSRVRFTVKSEGKGSVYTELWYETESPNKDGKKVFTDIAKFCIRAGAPERTFGPYEIPQGPCKFTLNRGGGKIEITVNVEVAEPKPDGTYGPFKKALKVDVTVTG